MSSIPWIRPLFNLRLGRRPENDNEARADGEPPIPDEQKDSLALPEACVEPPMDMCPLPPSIGTHREYDDDTRAPDEPRAAGEPKDSLVLPESRVALSDEACLFHDSTAEADHDGKVGAATDRQASERTAPSTVAADVSAGLQEVLAVPHEDRLAKERELGLESVVELAAVPNETAPMPAERAAQALECTRLRRILRLTANSGKTFLSILKFTARHWRRQRMPHSFN